LFWTSISFQRISFPFSMIPMFEDILVTIAVKTLCEWLVNVQLLNGSPDFVIDWKSHSKTTWENLNDTISVSVERLEKKNKKNWAIASWSCEWNEDSWNESDSAS
jgi:hypothetical protein